MYLYPGHCLQLYPCAQIKWMMLCHTVQYDTKHPPCTDGLTSSHPQLSLETSNLLFHSHIHKPRSLHYRLWVLPSFRLPENKCLGLRLGIRLSDSPNGNTPSQTDNMKDKTINCRRILSLASPIFVCRRHGIFSNFLAFATCYITNITVHDIQTSSQ